MLNDCFQLQLSTERGSLTRTTPKRIWNHIFYISILCFFWLWIWKSQAQPFILEILLKILTQRGVYAMMHICGMVSSTRDVAPLHPGRGWQRACESPCHGDSLPLEVETNPPTWNEGSGLRPNLGFMGKFMANSYLEFRDTNFEVYEVQLWGLCEVQVFSTENDLSTKWFLGKNILKHMCKIYGMNLGIMFFYEQGQSSLHLHKSIVW